MKGVLFQRPFLTQRGSDSLQPNGAVVRWQVAHSFHLTDAQPMSPDAGGDRLHHRRGAHAGSLLLHALQPALAAVVDCLHDWLLPVRATNAHRPLRCRTGTIMSSFFLFFTLYVGGEAWQDMGNRECQNAGLMPGPRQRDREGGGGGREGERGGMEEDCVWARVLSFAVQGDSRGTVWFFQPLSHLFGFKKVGF